VRTIVADDSAGGSALSVPSAEPTDQAGIAVAGPSAVGRLRRLRFGSTASVLWILVGSGFGQLIALAVSPVLTRLYTPAQFGLLTVFISVTSVLGTFVVFRFDAAIPLPRSDRVAAAVAWLGLGLTVVLSLAIGLLGPVLAGPVSRLVGSPDLAGVWWLVAAATFMIAVDSVLLTWMVREKRYRALALRNVLQGVGQAGGQVGLGWTAAGPVGLLIGWIIGRIAAVGGLFSRGGLFRQGVPRRATMRLAASRYRRFPLIASWSALLNSLGQQAPFLVISAYYGSVTIGLLGLTVRVMAAPVTLIGQAVARVFQGEASAAVRERSRPLRPIVRSNATVLLAIAAPLAVLVLILGPWLFAVVFGRGWQQAGEFARILALGYVAQLAVSPISQTLLILEKQGTQLAWDALRMIVTVGGPLVAAIAGATPTQAILVLAAGYVVCYSTLFVTCYRAAGRHDERLAVDTPARAEANPRRSDESQ
jgi:O-antigen/teichoic acid export membrane protein